MARKQYGIKFDEDFIAFMDGDRGTVPRARWIEERAWKPATSIATRSPEPPVEKRITRGPDDADHWTTRDVEQLAAMAEGNPHAFGNKRPAFQKRSK